MNTTTAKLFEQLEEQLRPMKKILAQASEIIINERVSDYPIFVVHQHEAELGIPIVDHLKDGLLWSINASTLEEFVAKGIVLSEKVNDFKNIYKPPADYACLFVLSELGATFVFLPRI